MLNRRPSNTRRVLAVTKLKRKWRGLKLVFKGTSRRRYQGGLHSQPFGNGVPRDVRWSRYKGRARPHSSAASARPEPGRDRVGDRPPSFDDQSRTASQRDGRRVSACPGPGVCGTASTGAPVDAEAGSAGTPGVRPTRSRPTLVARADRGTLAARASGRARMVVLSAIDLRLDQNPRTPPALGIVSPATRQTSSEAAKSAGRWAGPADDPAAGDRPAGASG